MGIDHDILRRIDLFKTLDEADLARVADRMIERHYTRGEIVLLEGARGGAFHYVASGLIKVYTTSPTGKEQILRLMTPGSTFNDVPALDGGPNPASAAALEPSTLFALSHADLHRLVLEHPAVTDAAIKSLAGALRHLVSVIEMVSFLGVTARVAKILLEQESAITRGEAPHAMTQQEIAAMAGTAREMVGRAFKELEASGAITITRGRAVVLDADRLRLLL